MIHVEIVILVINIIYVIFFLDPKQDVLMFLSLTACVCSVSPLSDFLILPGFIDFTSDEVVSIITLPMICISQATYCVLFPGVHYIFVFVLFVCDGTKKTFCGQT